MRRLLGYLALAFAVLALIVGCGRKVRIIPRETMASIYAEMLLADQWVRDHGEYRTMADTSLFYETIFKRYGYTFEDYDASVRHYLEDPDKFAKVFRSAARILDRRVLRYRAIQRANERAAEFNRRITGYSPSDFKADTLLWRHPDTLRRLDSIRRAAFVKDSLRLDSLRIDSLRRDSLRLDSLRFRRAPAKYLKRHHIKPINQ